MDSAQDLFNPAPLPQEFATPSQDRFFVGNDGSRAMLTSEEGTLVRFFEAPYKLEEASRLAGLPIHETRTFVEIKCKFDPKNTHVHLLRKVGEDEWKVRFQREWDFYCRSKEYSAKGFPILKWDEVEPHVAASLEAIGILTLEELVVAEDEVVSKLFPNPKKIKEAALAQLNYKNKVAEITGVTKKLVEAEGKLETANEMIERLELEKRTLTNALNAVKSSQRLKSTDIEAKRYLANVRAEKESALKAAKQEAKEPEAEQSDGIIISGD